MGLSLRAQKKHGSFLLMYVDDIKFVGKKQHITIEVEILHEKLTLNPYPLIHQVYLGCTRRERQSWITRQFSQKLRCSTR